jgi:hypothetical protein
VVYGSGGHGLLARLGFGLHIILTSNLNTGDEVAGVHILGERKSFGILITYKRLMCTY